MKRSRVTIMKRNTKQNQMRVLLHCWPLCWREKGVARGIGEERKTTLWLSQVAVSQMEIRSFLDFLLFIRVLSDASMYYHLQANIKATCEWMLKSNIRKTQVLQLPQIPKSSDQANSKKIGVQFVQLGDDLKTEHYLKLLDEAVGSKLVLVATWLGPKDRWLTRPFRTSSTARRLPHPHWIRWYIMEQS